MKKIALRVVPLFLCAATLCVGEAAFAQNAEWEARLTKQVQQTQQDLYALVARDLQRYYNRTDFADPQRQTGWFRVQDFLTWLEANSPELQRILAKNTASNAFQYPPKTPQDYAGLGGFLGSYYIASKFAPISQINPLFIYTDQNMATSANSEGHSIYIQPEPNGSLADYITLGIHEGAHMLPVSCFGKTFRQGQSGLSELVTVSATLQYGLPSKSNAFHAGARNVLRAYSATQTPLFYEYAQAVLAYVQHDSMRKLFEQGSGKIGIMTSEKNPFNVYSLLADLFDQRGGKLFLNSTENTLEEYLMFLRVPPADRPAVARFLQNVLTELDRLAPPPKAGGKMRAVNDAPTRYNKYFANNAQTVDAIIIKHLQKLPPPPPIPAGYL